MVNAIVKLVLLSILIGLANVGLYASYDSSGILEPALVEQWNFTDTQVGQTYTAYMVPSIFVPIAVGLAIDKLPVRFGLASAFVFCQVAVASGALVVALSDSSFWIFIFGRVLIGIGGEALLVCQYRADAKWFRASGGIAFANAVFMVIAESTEVFTFNALPAIARATSLPGTFWVICGLAGFSVITTALYVVYDVRNTPEDDPQKEMPPVASESSAPGRHWFTDFWQFLKELPLRYWFAVNTVSLSIGVFFTLMAFSTAYLVERWGTSAELGARLSSLTVMTTAVTSIPLGLLIDRFGGRLTGLAVGCAFEAVALATLSLAPQNSSLAGPIVSLVLVGFTYANMSVIQGSCWSLMLPESKVSLGTGISQSLTMVWGAILPPLLGYIRDKSGTFRWGMFMLLGLATAAFVLDIFAIIADRKYGRNSIQIAKPESSPTETTPRPVAEVAPIVHLPLVLRS